MNWTVGDHNLKTDITSYVVIVSSERRRYVGLQIVLRKLLPVMRAAARRPQRTGVGRRAEDDASRRVRTIFWPRSLRGSPLVSSAEAQDTCGG